MYYPDIEDVRFPVYNSDNHLEFYIFVDNAQRENRIRLKDFLMLGYACLDIQMSLRKLHKT